MQSRGGCVGEVVGLLREYGILIFGFPVRVIVWILIALFLGLIFSMLQWPEFWRKIFSKKHAQALAERKNEELKKMSAEEKAVRAAKVSRKIAAILFWIVLVLLVLIGFFYLIGWLF